MSKIHLIVITTFILGIGCFIIYNIIGSYVASDGTLIEPFGLIPIGWLFIIIGIILSIFLYGRSLLSKK